MRLGKIEKLILTEIGNGDWDYTKERKELRKDAGYDPDRHVEIFRESHDTEGIPDKILKKALKTYQASYSRALNGLIKKGLIKRSWILHIDLGIPEERFKTVTIEPSYGLPNYPKELVITFNDQMWSRDPEFDIPKCNATRRTCEFNLTAEGHKVKKEKDLYPSARARLQS